MRRKIPNLWQWSIILMVIGGSLLVNANLQRWINGEALDLIDISNLVAFPLLLVSTISYLVARRRRSSD